MYTVTIIFCDAMVVHIYGYTSSFIIEGRINEWVCYNTASPSCTKVYKHYKHNFNVKCHCKALTVPVLSCLPSLNWVLKTT